MATQFAVPPPGIGEAPRQELWIEAKAPDGKTTWSLPAGAQVLKPTPTDGAAAAGGGTATAAGGQTAASTTGAVGGAAVGSVTAQNAVAQAQAASQYQIGSQIPHTATSQPPLSLQQQPPGLHNMMPPGMNPNPMMAPHGGMMGPGMHNPMFGMGMPPPGMGFMNMSPFAPMIPPSFAPPQIQRDPADWNEYRAPDGRSYWYNSKINQSSWEKPPELAAYELKKKAEADAAAAASNNAAEQGKSVDAKPVEAKKEASTKPIATKQIPGTPWCVVWTSDKKSFFHNPSTKASVWKRPPELLGIKEVDDLLAQIPDEPVAEPVKPVTTNGESNGGIKREAKDEMDESAAKKMRAGSVDEGSISDTSSTDTGALASSTTTTTPRTAANAPRKPAPIKEKPKDPAYEAEQKAAKDRELIPLEERINKFRELLEEKEVSAYSTWEKELHKIVFDPRYLLLTSKDRRDVFDEHTREKADKEREEKNKKMGEVKENFKKLLEEANITSKSTFTEFSSKFGKDERFRAIDRSTERTRLFESFMDGVKKKEKEQRRAEADKLKSNFLEMLQEITTLNRKSDWSEVKKKLRDDPRYERIDSRNQREEWFNDYVKTLAKEKKKEKEKESDETEEKEPEEDDEKVKEEREKQERIQASIRERQRQVEEEMSTITKDREKEREHHRFDEAVQHYKALLTDLIRQTDLTYKAARKIMKKDDRYELADPLSKHQKEQIYDEHLDALSSKKKQTYRDLLDENDVALDASWKEVRRKIREDPRYAKFSSSESKCEKEFNKYLKDKTSKALMEFKELLKETKLIDYKTKSRIEENEQNMKDVIEILKNDARYLILEPMHRERKEILMEYLDDLARRGPPPPPTATDGSRRGK